jgi:type IV pilus assembly protein PilW
MVALTIGLLLLAGLTVIFVNSSEANRELQKTAQQIENGRYATDILVQDLRHAGFYGHYYKLPDPPVGLPDPCETAALASIQDGLPLAVQGYRAPDLSTRPDVSGTTCDDKGLLTAANLQPGSDVLVVRRADTNALATTAVAISQDIFLQATGIQAEIQLGNGAAIGTNKANGTASALFKKDGTPAPIRKYHVHVYFVAPCSVGSGANGVCQAGDDTIPTLKRLELASVGGVTTMRLVPLVEGIEYLKVEYGFDSFPDTADTSTGLVGDATADCYDAIPPANCPTPSGPVANWANVIAAKVYVLARNIERTSGHVDSKSYLLGTAPGTVGTTIVAATNDNYRRHVYTAAVRLMNTSGRREIP